MDLLKKNIRILLILILFVIILLEILCATHFVGGNRILYGRTSIPYFVCGILIALIPMFKVPPIREIPSVDSTKIIDYVIRGVKVLFGGYLIYELAKFSSHIFTLIPVGKEYADMMPIIQVMCQRFLRGEAIYEPIHEIWGDAPIYLPAMWGPFVPFEFAGVDIRWGSVVGLMLSIVLVLEVFSIRKKHPIWLLLVFPPLFFWAQGLWQEQTFLIRFAEEGVVVFHYAFLGYAILRKNPYLIGIGLALCILSRYGLLFWVPFFLLFLFFSQSRKDAFIATGVALSIGIFCFLIPYGIEKFDFFTSLPGNYPDYARRLWAIEADNKFFATTLGLAKFFSAETVDFQHRLHLVSIFLAPAFMLLAFWQLKKNNIWEGSMWGICSLKLTLTFFYNLIIVPVLYLFWVPPILSCLILVAYSKSSHHLQKSNNRWPK